MSLLLIVSTTSASRSSDVAGHQIVYERVERASMNAATAREDVGGASGFVSMLRNQDFNAIGILR